MYGALWGSASLQDSYVGHASNKSTANGHAYNRCLRAGNTNPEYRNDCSPGVWVKNGYLAFAMDVNARAWGSGWGHESGTAVGAAKKTCRNHGGKNCAAIIHVYRTRTYAPSKPTSGGIPPGP